MLLASGFGSRMELSSKLGSHHSTLWRDSVFQKRSRTCASKQDDVTAASMSVHKITITELHGARFAT